MQDDNRAIVEAVRILRDSYSSYMVALKNVLDFGESNVGPLVNALDDKFASPIAKALGLMMHSEDAAAVAIPRLLDWIIGQCPMYPEVLEALVRAGDRVLPMLLDRLRVSADSSDDEAVRNLLDLGTHLSDAAMPQLVDEVKTLLLHGNPAIREAAADAIWNIGLPNGLPAAGLLHELSCSDPDGAVKESAREALDALGVVAR